MKINQLTDSQLISREAKLRVRLPTMDKWSKDYERLWTDWFYLREAGVQRKLFRFFVPAGGE